MIPTKDKTYFIAFKGYHEYDGYIGMAKCLNGLPDQDGWFEFELLDPTDLGQEKTALFAEEDVKSELV